MTKMMTSAPKIHVQCAVRSKVPSVYLLKKWANLVLSNAIQRYEITIRIVNAAESQTLNKQFRGKDKPTNVLAFPNTDDLPIKGILYLGDLVLCHPVIAEEAKAQGKALDAHYAHMIIHGLLHLLGDDHILDQERIKMEEKEVKLLALLNYPNPYEVD